MKRSLLAFAALGLFGAAALAHAGPPRGGGRYVGPPGHYPGGAYRPFYPAYRPVYPAWRAGYWGPGYWGPWPYAWGATVALPYAVAPLVVNTAPAAPVVQPLPEAPASSYWYYCTQPAGYFPYVQQCSQPWMKVVPQVPGSTSAPPQLAP
jgi:hypothetical protein